MIHLARRPVRLRPSGLFAASLAALAALAPAPAGAVAFSQFTSTNTGGDNSPSYNRDGSAIYYASRVTGFQYIYWKASGAPMSQVGSRVSTQIDWDESNPTLSPDNTQVAYAVQDSAAGALAIHHLWRSPAGGTMTQTKLTYGPADDQMPDWWGAPGNEWIAFTSNRGGSGYQIWVMRPNGTQKQQVTPTGSSLDLDASFSPDGQQIVLSSNRAGTTELYTVSRSGSGWGSPVQVTFGGNAKAKPAWSPNGLHWAYQEYSGGTGGTSLWVMDTSGPANPREVTSMGSYAGDPAWSPGTDRIAFASDSTGHTYIWVADAITTPTLPVSWGHVKDRYRR